MKLKPCPYCNGHATAVLPSSMSATAIYCDDCPLGMEDDRFTIEQLSEMWNNLPRCEERAAE